MHSSEQSVKSYSDDVVVLDILLELSNTNPPEWKPHFPYLDQVTVSEVSRSISRIISSSTSKPLKRQVILLLRKLCSGTGTSLAAQHALWMGQSLSSQEAIQCLLNVCIPLVSSDTDWEERDAEQHLALSYAILGASVNKPWPLHPEAGAICDKLVKRILRERILTSNHHRFLAEVWESAVELPLDFEALVHLVERSSLGVERSLLWLGKSAVSDNEHKLRDALETCIVGILIRICCQSPLVFQTVSKILTQMMVVTEAHCGIQELIKCIFSRIEEECAREGCDSCALHEESCQVVSALMCIDPTLLPINGSDVLSCETVLQMLVKLPHEKAACLLAHRPTWLPFICQAEI